MTSAYDIRPDLGIAVEVCFASDYPDSDPKVSGDIKLGSGPVIARGPNINPVLFDLLTDVAKQEHIPYQVIGIPKASGTDANVMQLARGGVATALVSIPLRYMHTPAEILDWSDLQHAIKLLTAICTHIHSGRSFVPN